ncbi:MAG: DUF1573 domain-containing protein [Phycisphaerae bacterium]
MTLRRIAIGLAAFVVMTFGAFYLGLRSPGAVPVVVARVHSAPAVSLDPTELDFGPQPWGIEIPFHMTLRNATNDPITIERTETSCACTVVNKGHAGRVVGPSETVVFDLTLETRYRPGEKMETFTVTPAGGDPLTCRLRVDVTPTYRVEPDDLDFGDVAMAGDAEPSRLLTFVSHAGRRIVGVPEADAAWLRAAVADRPDHTEILVRVLGNRLPPGVSTASLVITTNDPARPQTSVYVTARGVQALAPDPPHVFLMGTETQIVRVKDAQGASVRIVSAEPDRDGLRLIIRDDGTLEVSNATGKTLPDTVTVRITDARGGVGRFLVSTF